MAATTASQILSKLNTEAIRLGDIKKLGRELKKDHSLALELWATGSLNPRLLATLIFDKSHLDQEALEILATDLQSHDEGERNQIGDWLLANQLMKSKKTIALLMSWQQSLLPVLRRLFWYHQARLRWTGQKGPGNSKELLEALERELEAAPAEVQWAMNFCAGQIGIHEEEFRQRCVQLGEKTGLYKDKPVAKNCTPDYLPEFIRIEVAKRN